MHKGGDFGIFLIHSFNLLHFTGFGCILAHAMGLGKTLQIVTFSDIFLRATTGRHVLIIVPINTIQNWANEFKNWLPDEPFTVHLVSIERVKESDDSYDMSVDYFRRMVPIF